jgi:hypothetical protein
MSLAISRSAQCRNGYSRGYCGGSAKGDDDLSEGHTLGANHSANLQIRRVELRYLNSTIHKWKYRPTELEDALIRDAYVRLRMGDREAVKVVGRKIGWPRGAVCKRGAELGLARVKEQVWSQHELRMLEQCGHLAPTGIQRKLKAAGFARSVAAIQIKLNRERIKSNLEGYSACQLAGAMGIDAKKVLRWIKDGVLKAERRGTDRLPQQGGDTWWISDQGVRRFVLRFPEEIDLARVEKIWFLNLVTNGKLYSGLRS